MARRLDWSKAKPSRQTELRPGDGEFSYRDERDDAAWFAEREAKAAADRLAKAKARKSAKNHAERLARWKASRQPTNSN